MLVPWRQNVVKTGRHTTHDPGFAPRNRTLKLFGKCANESGFRAPGVVGSGHKVPEPARVTEFPKVTARRSRDMPIAPRRGMHD
jgi:hypothetical protein